MIRFTILAVTFFYMLNLNAQKTALFLGNSYTYVNDLPGILRQLSSSMGDSLYTDQSTPGGYRLLNHAANATTYTKIKSRVWDFVILQAQSQEPSWPVEQIENEVFPYAKQISDSIKANSVCSEILFYETWGRKYGDSYNCADWPPVCTFEGMNDRLLVGYYTMTTQNNASMAPVGMAWKKAIEDGQYPGIDLYSSDESHPSVYGTYLTACVFYNSIFHNPVVSDFYSTIPEEEALYLQSVANSLFTSEYEYLLEDSVTSQTYDFTNIVWVDNGISTIADFDYQIDGTEISFVNQSIHAVSFEWDFGDGSPHSTQINPVYSFANYSNYIITLIANSTCINDTSMQLIDLTTDLLSVQSEFGIKVQVNVQSVIFSRLQSTKSIEIYSIKGEKLWQQPTNGKDQLSIPVTDRNSVWIVKFIQDDGLIISKKIVL
ncbi:MAG: hypothetical protein JXR60_07695 [Bacteroidales bacterium]|nr:hypothetical protein [Bacteroidales bacterium]